MLTCSLTDRLRSRCIKARAARKLDLAFSLEIGLYTTKFAPLSNVACKSERASIMATVMDLRLRSPERIPCNSEKSWRSLQSMMTASNLRCASFLLAWAESGQCSTSISNSPRTLRRRRTVRSSEQTTRDWRFITLTRNSTKKSNATPSYDGHKLGTPESRPGMAAPFFPVATGQGSQAAGARMVCALVLNPLVFFSTVRGECNAQFRSRSCSLYDAFASCRLSNHPPCLQFRRRCQSAQCRRGRRVAGWQERSLSRPIWGTQRPHQ